MIIKTGLALLLLMCIGIQGFFIYWLGGYDPGLLNQLLHLWDSFDTPIPLYTTWVLSIAKMKTVWLLPMGNLISGLGLIFKKQWSIGLLAVILSFVLAMAWVCAVYPPHLVML